MMAVRSGWCRKAFGACLPGAGLSLQIDFGIAVRSLQRDVAEPGPDRVDINHNLQQVDCRAESQGMGPDLLLPG